MSEKVELRCTEGHAIQPCDREFVEKLMRERDEARAYADQSRGRMLVTENDAALVRALWDAHRAKCTATETSAALPCRAALPVITTQMLVDYGLEGFFEKTDKPVHGVPGVNWSQAAVDFVCLLHQPAEETSAMRCPHDQAACPNPKACGISTCQRAERGEVRPLETTAKRSMGWGPNRDGQNMLGKLWIDVRAHLRNYWMPASETSARPCGCKPPAFCAKCY